MGPSKSAGRRPGLPYTGPPLITFSGPLPAGTDNARGAFEVQKGCRDGSRGTLLPSWPSLGGGGQQDKTQSRLQPGPPKCERQRENKQVWSQAHGAVSVPRSAEPG
jgi:hypothetical protein